MIMMIMMMMIIMIKQSKELRRTNAKLKQTTNETKMSRNLWKGIVFSAGERNENRNK